MFEMGMPCLLIRYVHNVICYSLLGILIKRIHLINKY